jgi:hypothetical protein
VPNEPFVRTPAGRRLRLVRATGQRFSVIALATVATLGGIWVLSGAVGLRAADVYRVGDAALSTDVPRLFWVGWGVMLLASAVLIPVRPGRGWALLMVATCIGLVVALWQWWIGNLEPVRMAILVATAFYLNARNVRDVLLPPTGETTIVPLAPPD